MRNTNRRNQILKKIIVLACVSILIGLGFNAFVSNAAAPNGVNHPHSHHKEWSKGEKEQILELKKQGYDKHDIFQALHLAKLTNKDAEVILAHFKDTKSWESTAQHFGVAPAQLKHHHPHHWKKYNAYLEKNKDKLVPYLAEYLNKDQREINGYLQDGTRMHTMVKASVLAKLSNTEVTEILTKKQNGKSFRKIADELDIEKEAIYSEIKKMKKAIKNQ
jgi:predicted DNA-binding protein YlxM (UPF0122 family)